MRFESKQNWSIGATVRVGFVEGLRVIERVASPGNYRPDGYVLRKAGRVYAFVPHDGGLTRCADVWQARQVIRS